MQRCAILRVCVCGCVDLFGNVMRYEAKPRDFRQNWHDAIRLANFLKDGIVMDLLVGAHVCCT